RKLWIIFNEEAPRRIVVAAIPQGVEFGREIVEEEGDSVRLVSQRRALQHPRILRRAFDQRQLLIVEQRQIGAPTEIDAGVRRLALERADPRMGILDVEDWIVLRRFDHFREVEVERGVGPAGEHDEAYDVLADLL